MPVEVDIIRTVKVNGAIAFSSATEQVFPAGCNQVPVAVNPGVLNQSAAIPIALARLQALVILATQPVTLYVNAINAAWSLAVTATGGTFTLSYGGQTTAALAWNAAAAQAQAALQALSSIGAGNALVSGNPGALAVQFAGTLGAQAIAGLTVNAGSLTGGTATATSTTAGQGPTQTFALQANIPIEWTLQSGYQACPLTSNVAGFTVSNAGTVAASVTFVVGANV